MKRWMTLLMGLCLGWAGAGGAGQPIETQSPESRTIPVVIVHLDSPGVFVCADGQSVFAEATGDQLRLTRRGEVFVLPSLAQPGGYGENGVSWVSTNSKSAELTLGRAQPMMCQPAVLHAGPTQFYRCAQGISFSVTPYPGSVLIVEQTAGAAPHVTNILPLVRSASGAAYQNSQWAWRSKGSGGQLERAGKVLAQGCRLR